MSTLTDVLKGSRETIVMDERVRALSERVDLMDEQLDDARERLIVIETMLSLLRPQGAVPRLPKG